VRQRERFSTVVIGGGQAGLAVGYYLAKHAGDFVILDRHDRIGDAWRTRWEGLRLYTAGRLNSLPGMPFPGDRHALPTKDEVADYLEGYAAHMALPVRSGVRVDDVWPAEDGQGFRIVAGDDEYLADEVVIATGAYETPRVPEFADDLDRDILQLHSSEFRSASQLRDGAVLVVGASNSGAEIALIAAREHQTVLCGRNVGKMPFRPEDAVARIFDPIFWFFINNIATLDTPIGRKVQPGIRDHGLPLDRVRPDDLVRAGVERTFSRVVGVRDGMPLLDDDRVIRAGTVVWATGFVRDLRWIHFPLTGPDGWPMQRRGVVATVPGLYFIGLPFMYAGGSALLGGVGRDAAYLVDHLASRMASRASPAGTGAQMRSRPR
jgi:putative flavoprotein involved in K+ transport